MLGSNMLSVISGTHPGVPHDQQCVWCVVAGHTTTNTSWQQNARGSNEWCSSLVVLVRPGAPVTHRSAPLGCDMWRTAQPECVAGVTGDYVTRPAIPAGVPLRETIFCVCTSHRYTLDVYLGRHQTC
jgi:hypothetical protein